MQIACVDLCSSQNECRGGTRDSVPTTVKAGDRLHQHVIFGRNAADTEVVPTKCTSWRLHVPLHAHPRRHHAGGESHIPDVVANICLGSHRLQLAIALHTGATGSKQHTDSSQSCCCGNTRNTCTSNSKGSRLWLTIWRLAAHPGGDGSILGSTYPEQTCVLSKRFGSW